MPDQKSNRILIIDDDEITLSLVGYRLQKEGFRVDAARDGVSAIDMLRQHDYGVILLNILLPRLDGFGILQYLDEYQPHMRSRVIILTAQADGAALSIAGTYRSIRKPLDYTELVVALRQRLTLLEADAGWNLRSASPAESLLPN